MWLSAVTAAPNVKCLFDHAEIDQYIAVNAGLRTDFKRKNPEKLLITELQRKVILST